ncbi:MAG: DUF262 domain-containing protein [Acholeplasmatales bacterium]|nr:DUF262 domain-containing protein [Acholeplasmatales bacterium]
MSSFVTKQIDMPRFQRGSKWSPKQKIELAISIFKRYPLGSVIFCTEKENNEITKNYLIDGRQRYTTIKEIYETPDVIYTWAKSYFSLNNAPDIDRAFWDKVIEYTNYDKNEKSDDDSDDSEHSTYQQNGELFDGDQSIEDNNLKTLLALIKCCHESNSYNNGLTKQFDFKAYISNVNKYEKRMIAKDSSSAKKKIDCRALKMFLYDYMKECERSNIKYNEKENFLDYIDDTFGFKDDSKRNKCRDELFGFWEDNQLKVFSFFKKIDSLLDTSKIATITVEDVPANDEQKIFNVINTNGTPLTAAEVLSAKPVWNKPINSSEVNPETANNIKKLYKIVLENEDGCKDGFVRWDLPASLLMSLDNFNLFFPVKSYIQKYIDKKEDKQAKIITLGFKLISGYCTEKIKKNDLDLLGNHEFITARNIEDFRGRFNRMLLTINEMAYFKTFNSWELSYSTLIGDTPTLFFLLCCYYMFEKLGEPTATSNDLKARLFKKNCFLLMDQTIMEYVNGTWKGSSDSLLEAKLKRFKATFNDTEPIDCVSEAEWNSLIKDIIDNGKIKTNDISMSLMKPLVAHYYCMKGLNNSITQEFTTEFDHIIPQDRFKDLPKGSKYLVNENNLYNLGLLPKSSNSSKGSKVLTDLLSNEVLRDNVVKYEEIPVENFSEFTKATDLDKLKTLRGEKYTQVFSEKRNEWIN